MRLLHHSNDGGLAKRMINDCLAESVSTALERQSVCVCVIRSTVPQLRRRVYRQPLQGAPG